MAANVSLRLSDHWFPDGNELNLIPKQTGVQQNYSLPKTGVENVQWVICRVKQILSADLYLIIPIKQYFFYHYFGILGGGP